MQEPPDEFGESFLEWLSAISEELGTPLVETPGLTEEDIAWLERNLGTSMPVQLRLFYEHCSPWGIWRFPQEEWSTMRQRIADSCTGFALLPVDINSQVGNCVVALVEPSGKYEIGETIRDKLQARRYPDLRAFFVSEFERERKGGPTHA